MEIHLKQEIQLTHAQRLELRQELAQQIGLSIESVRDQTDDAPLILFREVISKIIKSIEEPQIRDGMLALLSDSNLEKQFLAKSANLALPTKEKIQNFVLDYIFDSHLGHFRIERLTSESEKPIIEEVDISRGDFTMAFSKPERLRNDIEDLHNILQRKAKGGETSGEMRRIREAQHALNVAESLVAQIATLNHAITLALVKAGPDNKPMLSSFLRDLEILQRLNPLLSERIQKRFVARFIAIRGITAERFESAFLNTIGEYVLVSMGILSQDLFALQKGERNKEEYLKTKSVLKEAGIDADQLLKHYQLTGAGTFFWHRWHTIGQPLTPVTDDAVREFITQTVRADAEVVLEKLNYPLFFENAQTAARDTQTKEEREDKLREVLAESFASQRFQSALIEFIRINWYKKLDMFMG
ncbi:MAG TPA: hypothetical protein VJK04_01630 [Candidatus Paceibacterota bacterium]